MPGRADAIQQRIHEPHEGQDAGGAVRRGAGAGNTAEDGPEAEGASQLLLRRGQQEGLRGLARRQAGGSFRERQGGRGLLGCHGQRGVPLAQGEGKAQERLDVVLRGEQPEVGRIDQGIGDVLIS